MPKWVFHHTAGAFTAEEKQQIAKGMTKIYSSVGLPPFYSNCHFIEFQADSIYAGGETPKALTTVAIYHVARTFANDEIQDLFMQGLDDTLRPILKPKGIKWESAIYEGDIEYWRINGLIPPSQGSEMEKKWFEANQITDEEDLLRNQKRP
ncbi:hypothetical protein BHE90_005262 [Fusarium euwallaceae]|uniref:Tautomerase cis-CaaD-like domain-containing protein n=1 Tax=Fusarium euwallaceae TaxID=1147111 RepID=A0A430LX31_9HYPO|nr:hypothetical protein BHE90_005262 [Fusarium euwallaceae]